MDDTLVWYKNTKNSNPMFILKKKDSDANFEYHDEDDNQSKENLISLSYVNIPTIMDVLKNRYLLDDIYTYNGNVLISINPFKNLSIYDNNQYLESKPHVYSIANKAYADSIHKNQSILVSGESGSGKTENTKYILKYLCENYSDNSMISKKIINSNYVIELFGNA